MTALLEISGLRKQFGGLTAVRDVSFAMAEGEIVALLGPNGSGKTTVLNMISGALSPTAGRISLAGEEVSGLPPHLIARRGVARTFQLVRVLPSLTVAQNIAIALAYRPAPLWGRAAEARIAELLDEVGLTGRGAVHADDLTYIDQKRMELA
ncbi:MAG: ATP-binding cassette domain-containing protein, partial [Paracoccus sp. (in: a-proteobacteria)]|nr:ATP-binding cassette domain-containing protein [Paracoccus sp. (in: a-proteobacteria)]